MNFPPPFLISILGKIDTASCLKPKFQTWHLGFIVYNPLYGNLKQVYINYFPLFICECSSINLMKPLIPNLLGHNISVRVKYIWERVVLPRQRMASRPEQCMVSGTDTLETHGVLEG